MKQPSRIAAPELARLELLAEVDTLMARLRRWGDAGRDWLPAESVRALIGRLAGRAEQFAVRIDAPLIVATLGGSGTGKSALINAIVGEEVVPTGRQRPTTTRPTLICRSDLSPELLGIDPANVEVIHRDTAVLADLVLIDCPDPDTAEDAATGSDPEYVCSTVSSGQQPGQEQEGFGLSEVDKREHAAPNNRSRLRQILPHCDVLLVTTTQQKYRSARVADELAAASAGARAVFVQTHADTDTDVREDWARLLGEQYEVDHVYRVDSLSALDERRRDGTLQDEFSRLMRLLTQDLSGTAATRIRRANFLDLVAATLQRCRRLLDDAMPPVERLLAAIDEQRGRLAAQLAAETREELLASRRAWDNRLLGQSIARWGLSPFALVLRVYQGLGGLLAGSLLWRMRSPAQMALWGAVQGTRQWQQKRQSRNADQATARAVAGCWDKVGLHKATLVLGGYALESGLPRELASASTMSMEAEEAGQRFVDRAAAELEMLVARLARRHTGWTTRFLHESALLAMLGFLLYRLGKNFFYDSWLAPEPVPVYGLDFYLAAGFWLALWCLLLIWLITKKLRRGLRREVDELARSWTDPEVAAGLFADLEEAGLSARQFRRELEPLAEHVENLRRNLT